MPDAADPPVFNIWRLRAIGDDGSPRWVALVLSTLHPHQTLVDVPEAEAEAALRPDEVVAVAEHGADGAVARLQVSALAAPKAPPLWFAELDEPDSEPPAISLVAFTDVDAEPGTLFDRRTAKEARLRSAEQVGAFRWYPSSGFVDQVYVAPAWRRRTVATALLAAVGALTGARGWAPVWGDGQRTADGERWKNASLWADTAPEITHILPPMTPMDERID